MANEEHLARLKRGVIAWNQWREANRNVRPDLNVADLDYANLSGADLTDANLSGADLRRANLSRANLTGANLAGARLAGVELAEAHLARANLTDAFLVAANLTDANLSGADLSGAALPDANLTDANLSGADLNTTHLADANFSRADLTDADLSGANLAGATLAAVDLARARLTVAYLFEADLTKANLTKAFTSGTIFANVDLSTARGLETVQHSGPSTIGIDTLYRSHGNIPDAFLRGAGVPDAMITYSKSLIGSPFEFYSCFISYSSKDQEFAERLHADLQNKGVRCWFAPEDIQGGRKLHDQIDQAIRLHERLLLILSTYSMQSEWVKTEIAKARQREVREKRQVLFPMRLVSFEAVRDWECFDADTGKDSAREIREYFIPDFSNWKNHDAYQVAFQRLLRDLKAEI